MSAYRYARWDGSQDPWADLGLDELVGRLSEEVLSGWSADHALRRMLDHGLAGRFQGLRALRERLERLRRLQVEGTGRPDPLADVRERLEQIKATEREALAADPDEQARWKELGLDALPSNLAGQIRELSVYQWASKEAAQAFADLLADLHRQVLEGQFRQISQAMQGMSGEDMARLKDMIADLNELLEQRAMGLGPSQEAFEEFMRRHGQFFPENPSTFDELLKALARRALAFSRFMASLTPEQQAELMGIADQLLGDLDLSFQIDRLSRLLRGIAGSLPWDQPMDLGGEPMGLAEGLDAIDQASRLEEMARALRQDYPGANLEDIDREELGRILGEEAVRDLERLRRIERALEEAGVVARSGGRLELTPRGVRKLGERALARVFERLTADQIGSHEVAELGGIDEPTGSSRPWRFGDPFRLDIRRTIHNAVIRGGRATLGEARRVRLTPEDFEVEEAERRTTVSTVLLLDMSRSMPLRGHWLPAKRMALALHTLITTTYPEDQLSIVGFSDYARMMHPADLAEVDWEPVYGTNMEHAFNLAGRLLAKQGEGSKQVLLVTDGEPTAHLEGEYVFFQWPPVRETLDKTYREAVRLARQGVTMNIFMLEQSPGLVGFVDRLARIVKGRVFAVTGDDLSDMVVRDYVKGR